MRILILLWLCALFGFGFWITFAILSCKKLTKDRQLSVKYLIYNRSLLLLLIKEHWVKTWELKSSVTNLFSWNKDGIRGIILLFKKHLSRDQYALQCLLKLVTFWSSVYNSIVLTYKLKSLTVPEDGLVY